MADQPTLGSPAKMICAECGSEVWKPYLKLVKDSKNHPTGREMFIICVSCPVPGHILARRKDDV